MINFYIDDQVEAIYSFTAEKGMTWEQWVNSEYSTYNNIIKDFKLYSMGSYYAVKCYHEYAGVYGDIYITPGSLGGLIAHSEIIENDKIYYWY